MINKIKKICPAIDCDNSSFTIELYTECSDCPNNGAYDRDEDDYIYDEEIIKNKVLLRDQAANDGQCSFDICFDNGCYMFTCTECGQKFMLPLMEN